MATAASGSDPYCTATQFVSFFDERSVRELLSDDEAPVTGNLDDNDALADILRSASGEVEASACAGQRYVINSSRNDLEALTGNSAAYLAYLVGCLAFNRLWLRRPNTQVQLPPACEKADEFLERLRLGERVFGILENHQAAALAAEVETPAQVEARRGLVYSADRLFGRRVNRLGGRSTEE
jgi:hypothetical protein